MSFAGDIRKHRGNLERLKTGLPAKCVEHVERSMKTGSDTTGAPGQPVRTGALRDSYRTERLGPAQWRVLSDSPYAMDVEDNVRGVTFSSSEGGAHSAKLTIAGWPSLVEREARDFDAG